MSAWINIKMGQCRTINYTGDIKHLGQTLAEEAMDDPELKQQILCAANEIWAQGISAEKGDQLIRSILNK